MIRCVHACEADRCGLRFLDRSPTRNRQWCSKSH
ncbi:CGNR zinc finger domain-containing protein [Streptomyces sviceus]